MNASQVTLSCRSRECLSYPFLSVRIISHGFLIAACHKDSFGAFAGILRADRLELWLLVLCDRSGQHSTWDRVMETLGALRRLKKTDSGDPSPSSPAPRADLQDILG